MSTLGTLDVACPGCGETLHIEIQAETVPVPVHAEDEAGVSVVLHPVVPDHSCPPPSARGPLDRAA